MNRLLAKTAYRVIELTFAILISPFLLAMILWIAGQETYRWVELHAVYGGDEDARDRGRFRTASR